MLCACYMCCVLCVLCVYQFKRNVGPPTASCWGLFITASHLAILCVLCVLCAFVCVCLVDMCVCVPIGMLNLTKKEQNCLW